VEELAANADRQKQRQDQDHARLKAYFVNLSAGQEYTPQDDEEDVPEGDLEDATPNQVHQA
jgi:hypothetical protein